MSLNTFPEGFNPGANPVTPPVSMVDFIPESPPGERSTGSELGIRGQRSVSRETIWTRTPEANQSGEDTAEPEPARPARVEAPAAAGGVRRIGRSWFEKFIAVLMLSVSYHASGVTNAAAGKVVVECRGSVSSMSCLAAQGAFIVGQLATLNEWR